MASYAHQRPIAHFVAINHKEPFASEKFKNLNNDWVFVKISIEIFIYRHVDGDNFRVRVRMDVGSDNYHPTEEMKQKLINHIKNTGKLGGSTAFYDSNFTFRLVQGWCAFLFVSDF